MKVKVTPVAEGGFVELPRDLLARYRLSVGDELDAVELPDGVKLVSPGRGPDQDPSEA